MKTSDIQYADIHKDLLDGCRRFDHKAQFQIYKLYHRAMYNICLRIVKDTMEAEDIMQEAFLSAFEKIETFSGTVSFGAWLKRIVENRSLDFLRKKRPVFEEIKEDHAICSEEGDTSQQELKAKVEIIRKFVMTMPKGYRKVLTMSLFEGYDHDEIGQILGIDPNSSRSHFSRARIKLLEKLAIHRISYR